MGGVGLVHETKWCWFSSRD